MNLSERLQSAPKQSPRQICKFGKWLDSLTDDDRKAVENALSDKSWSIDALTKVLIESGMPVGRNSVNHHRNRLCRACFGVSG
jgi:hypothetical protein